MISHMFLDLLGYHNTVEKHSSFTGRTKVPLTFGEAYALHPGYLSTPKSLTSIDWLTDHGAILEILSRHALLTGDKNFIGEWLPVILKGCEFIKDSCAATNHTGVKGLLPPAVATDNGVASQAVWNQAWNYKGLTTSVRLLKRLNHPRAAEFDQFAQTFRKRFVEAFMPKVQERRNGPLRMVSSGRCCRATLFRLPYGTCLMTLFCSTRGLFACLGPVCLTPVTRTWSHSAIFSAWVPTRSWRPQTSAISRATLRHEIASCEPCYSWNIVNSWATADRAKFLEGMYSLFTGAISPQTYVNCGTQECDVWKRLCRAFDDLGSARL